MMRVNVIVRLQKRATQTVSGKKFPTRYLTVPNCLVDALGLEPGAAFEPFVEGWKDHIRADARFAKTTGDAPSTDGGAGP